MHEYEAGMCYVCGKRILSREEAEKTKLSDPSTAVILCDDCYGNMIQFIDDVITLTHSFKARIVMNALKRAAEINKEKGDVDDVDS